MTFLMVNVGADWMMQLWTNNLAPTTLKLHLYTNNRGAIVCTDVAGTYTECVLVGYAAVNLTPGNWVQGVAAGCKTIWTYPSQTWTFAAYAGGTTIYGAYITNAAGTLLAAAPLDASFLVPAAGGSITINLTDQKGDCTA